MIIRTTIELCAAFVPGLLSSAGLQYVGFDGGIGGKIGRCREQGMMINCLDAAVQVDPIEYRTGKFAPVAGNLGADAAANDRNMASTMVRRSHRPIGYDLLVVVAGQALQMRYGQHSVVVKAGHNCRHSLGEHSFAGAGWPG